MVWRHIEKNRRNIVVTGQQGDLLGVWDSLMKNTAF